MYQFFLECNIVLLRHHFLPADHGAKGEGFWFFYIFVVGWAGSIICHKFLFFLSGTSFWSIAVSSHYFLLICTFKSGSSTKSIISKQFARFNFIGLRFFLSIFSVAWVGSIVVHFRTGLFCFFISGNIIVDGNMNNIAIDVVDDFLISIKGELFFDWSLFIILTRIGAAF